MYILTFFPFCVLSALLCNPLQFPTSVKHILNAFFAILHTLLDFHHYKGSMFYSKINKQHQTNNGL